MVRSSNRMGKRVRWIGVNLSRFLLSATFIFSGIVKLIDPVGTQYKIEDYAQAFGLSSLALGYVPLLLSVALGLMEFDLGINFFFGLHRKRTSRVALLFFAVFTPLTLYIALQNPVSDCGCFGDALQLTNWQTFYKNVVLLLAAVVVAYYYRFMTRFILERNQWIISLYSKVFGFVFVCINLYGLPVLDFRPYHIGADLQQKMGLNAEPKTIFLMEKDGVQKEFALEDYPDSTWNFVSSRVEDLGIPEITDFQMLRVEDGQDITDSFLRADTYKFLLVAPRLEQADDGVMDRIAEVYDYSLVHGYPFYCLTASGDSVINRWTEITGAEYAYCRADDVVLKTMIRSNPGLMLLHGGVVINKWPNTKLPAPEELNAPMEQLRFSQGTIGNKTMRLLRIFLWYVLPLLAVTIADRLWLGKKIKELYKHRV